MQAMKGHLNVFNIMLRVAVAFGITLGVAPFPLSAADLRASLAYLPTLIDDENTGGYVDFLPPGHESGHNLLMLKKRNSIWLGAATSRRGPIPGNFKAAWAVAATARRHVGRAEC